MQKYVAVSVEERLTAWRQTERAASEAEHAAAALGQGAADPRARDLYLQAKRLRDHADREFAAICRAIRTEDPPASGF